MGSYFLIIVMVMIPGELGTQKVIGPFADEKSCEIVRKQALAEFEKYHGTTPGLYILTRCTQERK